MLDDSAVSLNIREVFFSHYMALSVVAQLLFHEGDICINADMVAMLRPVLFISHGNMVFTEYEHLIFEYQMKIFSSMK